jgi:flagellar hook-basal body complex protein FliE
VTVEPLPLPVASPNADVSSEFDAPLAPAQGPSSFGSELRRAFDQASDALERAQLAEQSFVRGRGGLQEMVLERAQADVTLSLAAAAASRTVSVLTTIVGMQV